MVSVNTRYQLREFNTFSLLEQMHFSLHYNIDT